MHLHINEPIILYCRRKSKYQHFGIAQTAEGKNSHDITHLYFILCFRFFLPLFIYLTVECYPVNDI